MPPERPDASVGPARAALPALLGAYLILALAYGLVTPVLEAPDEHWHFGYVKYLADGHGLPVLSADRPDLQESHQPPLYYVLGALAILGNDTRDLPRLTTPNPHWGAGGRSAGIDNKNLFVHGWPQERFPYAGAALAVHRVRALSAALGVGTLLAVYALARTLLRARRHAGLLALSATGFVAFNPQFLYLSGAVNNDALVVLVCAAGLWLLARLALEPEGAADPLPLPWLGVVIGLGLLSKWSAGALLPAALLVVALRQLRRTGWRAFSWPAFIRAGLALGIPVLVIAGWWYLRNQWIYGDPLALGRVVQIFETRDPVPTVWEAVLELPQFEPSFWGRFGWENIPAAPWFDQAIELLDRLALVGLAWLGARWALARARGSRPLSSGEAIALAGLGLFGVILLALFVQWVRTTFPVGRHVFPGLPLAGLGLAAGLAALGRALARGPRGAWLAALAVAVPLSGAVLAPLVWIAPAYYPPPAPPAGELAAITPSGAGVGGTLRLLGFRLAPGQLRPAGELELTLYWQGIAPADRDWTIFVHVLGPDGRPVAQRDTFPAFGRISTRFVTPGQTWSERYVLQLPADLEAPATVTLSVGLYDGQTGERAPAPGGDSVRLAELPVVR